MYNLLSQREYLETRPDYRKARCQARQFAYQWHCDTLVCYNPKTKHFDNATVCPSGYVILDTIEYVGYFRLLESDTEFALWLIDMGHDVDIVARKPSLDDRPNTQAIARFRQQFTRAYHNNQGH